MGNCYVLIISVLASVSSSYGSQDPVITTSFGKTATLPCQIANQGSDLRSLYWGKDGKRIYSRISDGENANGENDNGKYSVTDTESLVIPDVTESDAGNYSCIVVRKSLATVKGDIMQLYVIGVSVSHCKDTGQEVDGCSCNINGSNITSLECSASGFPHPPVITWEEGTASYRSSFVDLTRFRENTTLTCKARDVNLKSVVENKPVCVYYAREVTSTGGSPVETTTASVHDQAPIAAIIISIILIFVLLERLKVFLAAVYKRKKGKAFHFPSSIMCTAKPKTPEEPDEPPLHGKDIGANDAGRVEYVLMDTSNWKNSKESSVGDLPTSQPESTSIAGGTGDVDFPPEDCNQNVTVVGDEQQLSLTGVGLVLLDDLRSAPEETKESIKAAAIALIVDPYKITHVDPNVTIHSLLINMNETLQRSVNTGDLDNHDAEFDRDRILDERDRDEFQVFIPEPESQEVTGESQIPACQGSSVIHQSLLVPAMSSSSSMVEFNPWPSFLRGEQQSSERAMMSNVIFRIIPADLVIGHSGLSGNSYLNSNTDMLLSLPMQSDMMSSMASSAVPFSTLSPALREELVRKLSERRARYNAFSQSILDLLETGHSGSRGSCNCSTAIFLGTVSAPVEQTWQEEDEIQDPPSTAKLLEDRCRDSEESDNEHHDYMYT